MMGSISYIVSFVTTIIGLCMPFSKKMKTVLTLDFLVEIMVAASYLLVAKFSGAAICLTAAVQVLINYIFDARGKKIPIPLIAVYVVVFVAINAITFAAWYDVLALAAALAFVFSMVQSKTSYYRIFSIANSLLWIVYDIVAKAYGNLFTHGVLLIAITGAVWLRDVRAKKVEQKL